MRHFLLLVWVTHLKYRVRRTRYGLPPARRTKRRPPGRWTAPGRCRVAPHPATRLALGGITRLADFLAGSGGREARRQGAHGASSLPSNLPAFASRRVVVPKKTLPLLAAYRMWAVPTRAVSTRRDVPQLCVCEEGGVSIFGPSPRLYARSLHKPRHLACRDTQPSSSLVGDAMLSRFRARDDQSTYPRRSSWPESQT